MVDEIVTKQELIDAKRDAHDLGESVNEAKVITPRYGDSYKSIPLVSAEAEAKISEFQQAIDAIVIDDGVPAVVVSTASDQNQQEINDFGGYAKYKEGRVYAKNQYVMLDNGDVAQAVDDGVVTNPNTDMTGWISHRSEVEDFKNETKKIAYANYRDVREWGVTPNRTTDYTSIIRDIVQNELGSYGVLYIPFGVRWNYSGIYNYLNDFQTIVDDSGRDEARGLWQSTRVTWHKTNANTGATNGNTETISGDYHPAYIIDTYGASGTAAARASVVFRLGGSSKWQTGMDATAAASHFSIAQYGSIVDGTKSLVIGHQDSTIAGKVGFHHTPTTSSMLYNFGKPSYIDDSSIFNIQFQQPAGSTADFQQYFRYGTTTAYREDVKVDGTHYVISKNSRRITTTADCVRYGARKNIKSLTASATLTLDETDSIITNINASSAISVTLPKAVIGLHYDFFVDSSQNLRITPSASDSFLGLVSGKYKESSTLGSKLRIVAVSDSLWSFEQSGTWSNQP